MKEKKRKEKEHRLLEKVRDEGQGGEGGLTRALASVHPQTRERGLQALTVWLSRRKEVTMHDLLRLWKALFYCYWHSDLAPVQVRSLCIHIFCTTQDSSLLPPKLPGHIFVNSDICAYRMQTALAERLSEIVLEVPDAVGQLYFHAFVHTMRREWFGIDRHRMDKFMLLIRKFYAAHLRRLQARNWELADVSAAADFWSSEVLLASDNLVAASVGYHIVDLFLPELNSVCQQGELPSDEALNAMLSPFCQALASSQSKVLIKRLQQGLFEPLAAQVRHPDEGVVALQNLDVAALAELLFSLGTLCPFLLPAFLLLLPSMCLHTT
jgi:ribosomal RNA-processing protein 1